MRAADFSSSRPLFFKNILPPPYRRRVDLWNWNAFAFSDALTAECLDTKLVQVVIIIPRKL